MEKDKLISFLIKTSVLIMFGLIGAAAFIDNAQYLEWLESLLFIDAIAFVILILYKVFSNGND